MRVSSAADAVLGVYRHQAYETWLAGRTVGEVFGRVTDFLNVAAAEAVAVPDADAFALPGTDL